METPVLTSAVTVGVASVLALVFLRHVLKKNAKPEIRHFHKWTNSQQMEYLSCSMDTEGITLVEAFRPLYVQTQPIGQPPLWAVVERYASKLLQREMPGMSDTPELKSLMLESFEMLLGANKDADQAIQNFVDVLQQRKDYVPAMLGLTSAYFLGNEKSQSRGRNYLKKMCRMQPSQEFTQELECAHLLLANIHYRDSKIDLASDEYRKCLDGGEQSSVYVEALEGLGDVMVKEAAWQEAESYFTTAWQAVANQQHGQCMRVGFKLAEVLMRLEQFDAAIGVCGQATQMLLSLSAGTA